MTFVHGLHSEKIEGKTNHATSLNIYVFTHDIELYAEFYGDQNGYTPVRIT